MTKSFLPEAGSIAATSARALRARILAGDLTARDVAAALLHRIAEVEPHIRAFAWHDPEQVLAQADALDAWLRAGRRPGPLHGVPVGVKDVIDTRDIATEYGCAVTRGHVPDADAAVIERLHAAGAIVMGKTVTTELAFMHPGQTRNPLNTDHTPGGSSSGSAAAVAAGMIPLAIGTQTGGSVTRPASFCGVVGFKPGFGVISRRGVLLQSHTLDTVGVFARDPYDAELLVDVLSGPDHADPATRGTAATALAQSAGGSDRRVLNLALVRLPGVDEAHYATLSDALAALPADRVRITECALPEGFEHIADLRERINFVEMAEYYAWIEARNADLLSDRVRAAMDAGKQVSAGDYMAALTARQRAQDALARDFGGYDAILSTATAGPPPQGLKSTGTAICNGLWTFTGAPAVNLPIGPVRPDGLRLGLQITASQGRDADVAAVGRALFDLLD